MGEPAQPNCFVSGAAPAVRLPDGADWGSECRQSNIKSYWEQEMDRIYLHPAH